MFAVAEPTAYDQEAEVRIRVEWAGTDQSWRSAVTRAIECLDYAGRELRGWEPAHSVDADWLAAAGRLEWMRTKSPFFRAIDHVRVRFRRASPDADGHR